MTSNRNCNYFWGEKINFEPNLELHLKKLVSPLPIVIPLSEGPFLPLVALPLGVVFLFPPTMRRAEEKTPMAKERPFTTSFPAFLRSWTPRLPVRSPSSFLTSSLVVFLSPWCSLRLPLAHSAVDFHLDQDSKPQTTLTPFSQTTIICIVGQWNLSGSDVQKL